MQEHSEENPHRRLKPPPWPLTIATTFVLIYFLAYTNSLDDDAFISMRYAANAAHGHGWVLNPGEAVEGTSSQLHLWLLTLLQRFFSINQTIWIQKLYGLAVAIYLLHLTHKLAQRLVPAQPLISFIAPIWLAVRPEFTLAMTNGLETSLAALFVTAGLWALINQPQDRIKAPLLFGLAALTRPELIPLGALMFAFGGDRRLKQSLPYIALVVFGLLVRHSLYGQWVPNTYFAKKMDLSDAWPGGIDYVGRYVGLVGTWAFLPPIAFFGFKRMPEAIRPFSIAAGLLVAFCIASGGNWMLDGRFLAPVMPVFACLWAGAISTFFGAKNKALAWGISCASLAFICGIDLLVRNVLVETQWAMAPFSLVKEEAPLSYWRCARPGGRRMMAAWIHGHVPPGQTVACSELGVPTILNLDVRFLDVRGLAEPNIARMSKDIHHGNVGVYLDGWLSFDNELLRYVLAQKPYAIVAFDGGNGATPELLAAYKPDAEFSMQENSWRVRTFLRK